MVNPIFYKRTIFQPIFKFHDVKFDFVEIFQAFSIINYITNYIIQTSSNYVTFRCESIILNQNVNVSSINSVDKSFHIWLCQVLVVSVYVVWATWFRRYQIWIARRFSVSPGSGIAIHSLQKSSLSVLYICQESNELINVQLSEFVNCYCEVGYCEVRTREILVVPKFERTFIFRHVKLVIFNPNKWWLVE